MELQTLEPQGSPEIASSSIARMAKESSGPRTEARVKPAWRIVLLPVSSIGPNPFQPRSLFDEVEMQELIASVRAHGVLQPVTVRTNAPETPTHGKASKKASPTYHLIAGERRLRACREAGRKTIPAIVRDDLSDAQAAELAIVENVQRANLSIVEEARGYRRLMLDFHLKEERIAKKVGKSVQTVRDTLRLLALPVDVQGLLSAKRLTASHGHELLRLAPFERVCSLVANTAIKDGLTAAALGRNPLPNLRELRDKKLLTELDFRTKFDWRRECGSCPHKAYIASGYGTYCLLPAEWVRKQNEAIERQKQEAARILDEAKRGSDGQVDVAVLPPGSYRDLSYGQMPAGCSASCPCRSESPDPRDPTNMRSICLDPSRFTELAKAERQAHEQARQRKFLALWQDAKTRLVAQVEADDVQSCAAIVLLPLITGQHLRYGGIESWRTQAQQVAQELTLNLPLEMLLGADTLPAQALVALQDLEVNDLLRFLACLLLAQEARGAVHFGGETPLLSFALGFEVTPQEELPHEEFPDGDEDLEPPDSEDD
ncbi:chromosome-partitioning protein Spo0J [Abditibacteriota bacterium]|nr:chromosome-partitioning protein Spo0J [Abditibacteriota bacterium]